MNRTTRAAVAVAATIGLSVAGAAAADAAPSAKKLNSADRAFLKSNEQVNLAEITLGHIVLRRSNGPRADMLAHMTISDHRAAMKKVKAVAKKDGVTLPTRPNAQQRAAAAKEKSARRPALTYFKLQVAGHKQSIAQTKYEIKHGSRPNVVAYARYYLPVAQKHLRMAEADLKRLQ
ncbi:DUF4142 domain-containing protein [uncultured Jatrophihabitans sp.]|uniref:DUF4142 domain-containing protein n=1 Tax=uncultured Jatrophihabitans sp. TaxID=1610747 RepID=UPI0035CA0345